MNSHSDVIISHPDAVRALSWNYNGCLATGCDDKIVRIYDPWTKQLIYELQGHKEAIKELQFSPAGNLLASCCDDMKDLSIRVWDTINGVRVRKFKPTITCKTLVWTPDQSAVVARGSKILMCDVITNPSAVTSTDLDAPSDVNDMSLTTVARSRSSVVYKNSNGGDHYTIISAEALRNLDRHVCRQLDMRTRRINKLDDLPLPPRSLIYAVGKYLVGVDNRLVHCFRRVFCPMSGWLEKEAGTHSKWDRRWFTLTGNGQLQYYLDPSLSELRGSFELPKCILEESEGREICIDDGNRKLKIMAHSVNEAEHWKSMIGMHAYEPLMEETIHEKCGYFDKQGGAVGTTWQKRWFVVHNGVMRWYLHHHDAAENRERGAIILDQAVLEGHMGGNAFNVHTDKQRYYFKCSSDIDRKRWIDFLSGVVREVHGN
jgi:hypothetical protein